MSEKSNKELAVDVAIAMINANPRTVRPNNGSEISSINVQSAVTIIQNIKKALDDMDKN